MYREQGECRQPDQANADADPPHADASDLWAKSLEAWVCSLNIERFRALLAEATDPRQRAILTRLLDDHAASFHRFLSADEADGQGKSDDA